MAAATPRCIPHRAGGAPVQDCRSAASGDLVPACRQISVAAAASVRIPRKLDTRSAANWTLVPAQTGQLFHAKLDTWGVTARGRGCGFTPDVSNSVIDFPAIGAKFFPAILARSPAATGARTYFQVAEFQLNWKMHRAVLHHRVRQLPIAR